jgi:hypothetical protein
MIAKGNALGRPGPTVSEWIDAVEHDIVADMRREPVANA